MVMGIRYTLFHSVIESVFLVISPGLFLSFILRDMFLWLGWCKGHFDLEGPLPFGTTLIPW